MCGPGQAIHVQLSAEEGQWETTSVHVIPNPRSHDDTSEMTIHLDLPSGRALIIIIINFIIISASIKRQCA